MWESQGQVGHEYGDAIIRQLQTGTRSSHLSTLQATQGAGAGSGGGISAQQPGQQPRGPAGWCARHPPLPAHALPSCATGSLASASPYLRDDARQLGPVVGPCLHRLQLAHLRAGSRGRHGPATGRQAPPCMAAPHCAWPLCAGIISWRPHRQHRLSQHPSKHHVLVVCNMSQGLPLSASRPGGQSTPGGSGQGAQALQGRMQRGRHRRRSTQSQAHPASLMGRP